MVALIRAATQGRPYDCAGQRKGKMTDQDIEKIRTIIASRAERFRSRMGDVTFAGVEGGTVKIAPSGFCWR